MAEITKEFLDQHILTMRLQMAGYEGAIQFAQSLVEHLEKEPDSMTLDEFAQKVAGVDATAEIVPTNNEDL